MRPNPVYTLEPLHSSGLTSEIYWILLRHSPLAQYISCCSDSYHESTLADLPATSILQSRNWPPCCNHISLTLRFEGLASFIPSFCNDSKFGGVPSG